MEDMSGMTVIKAKKKTMAKAKQMIFTVKTNKLIDLENIDAPK